MEDLEFLSRSQYWRDVAGGREHVTVDRFRAIEPKVDVLYCEFLDPMPGGWRAAPPGDVYHYFDLSKQGQIKVGDIVSIETPLRPEGARAIVRRVEHRLPGGAHGKDVQVMMRVDA